MKSKGADRRIQSIAEHETTPGSAIPAHSWAGVSTLIVEGVLVITKIAFRKILASAVESVPVSALFHSRSIAIPPYQPIQRSNTSAVV
jgi:hypothetical protein